MASAAEMQHAASAASAEVERITAGMRLAKVGIGDMTSRTREYLRDAFELARIHRLALVGEFDVVDDSRGSDAPVMRSDVRRLFDRASEATNNTVPEDGAIEAVLSRLTAVIPPTRSRPCHSIRTSAGTNS